MRKRHEPIGMPAFHALADELVRSSREIFRIAAEQDKLGEMSETGDVSTEDVKRED